jgi:nitrogenase subunit NifH
LKDGQTGYIAPTDVELVKPVDKIFILTQDAPVLDAPNRFAKKIAEVHKTHSVRVIGLALNYMQIRMKNGLVGFIPATALQ